MATNKIKKIRVTQEFLVINQGGMDRRFPVDKEVVEITEPERDMTDTEITLFTHGQHLPKMRG